MSPHRIVFGRDVQLPADLAAPVEPTVKQLIDVWATAKAAIERAQQRQKCHADRKRTDVCFEPGDYVLLHTRHLPLKASGSSKLMPLWVGPFKVLEARGPNAYRLDLPPAFHRIHPVVNVSQLKRYKGQVVPPPDPIDMDGLQEYEVAAILDHRVVGRRKRLEFLVSFVGFDSSANEWLPERNLEHAPEILAAYKQAHALLR